MGMIQRGESVRAGTREIMARAIATCVICWRGARGEKTKNAFDHESFWARNSGRGIRSECFSRRLAQEKCHVGTFFLFAGKL